MNIVFLLNSPYPYYTGGRETWLYNITQRLCERHNIYIIREKPGKNPQQNGSFSDIDSRIQLIQAVDILVA